MVKNYGITREPEPAWVVWIMSRPTLILALLLAVAATPVVVSGMIWGNTGSLVSIGLVMGYLVGFFVSHVAESKRT